MGRAKIPMEPITNPKKRKTTFNSRNNGMIKKARELATLCDVKISMIVFTDDQETPQIFPPDDHDKVKNSIDVYSRTRRTNPESIKWYTLSDYYNERKIKVEEELVKEKRKNSEAKFPSWFGFLDGFSEAGLREFAVGLEDKIVDVESKIECLKSIEYNMMMMMMQSWNPNLMDPIMRPSDSMMNTMLNEDVYDENYSTVEPPSLMEQYSFPHESWQQFLMSGFQ
ncbi:MADS-box protein CMB2-like [Bidens hawaiensis]|uniref:MADS-box protein CMB2-like n=1 Tax=Bidens hawaiensis TaxID=980011 RepID=UPI00404B62CB